MSSPLICQWCGAELATKAPAPHCSSRCAERETRGTLLPEERDRAEFMAGQRSPDSLIAAALGLCSRSWALFRKNDSQLREALARGRAREHAALVNALFEEATVARNVQAAQFLLRCRHNYSDKPDGADATRIQVQIALPGALSPQQYAELTRVASFPAAEVIDAPELPSKALPAGGPDRD